MSTAWRTAWVAVSEPSVPTTIELSEASFPWESDYNIKNKVVLVRVGSRSER